MPPPSTPRSRRRRARPRPPTFPTTPPAGRCSCTTTWARAGRLRLTVDQQRRADGAAEVAERGDLDHGRIAVDEEVGHDRVQDALGVGLAEADAEAAADDD